MSSDDDLGHLAERMIKHKHRWAEELPDEEFAQQYAWLFRKRELIIPQGRPLRAYIGAALATEPHRNSNRKLHEALRAIGVETYLPQEHGGLIREMIQHGTPLEAAKRIAFRLDMWGAAKVDVFIGADWEKLGDEGRCFEQGALWWSGKPCLVIRGKRTKSLEGVDNPMLTMSLAHEPFRNIATLCAWLKEEIEKRRAR